MKHYEGELGVFDYDETQFEIFIDRSIRYIGEETDGSKIMIPDGVVDLSYTFRNSKLVTPPRIPKSVVYCNCTFYYSYFLTQAAKLPEGVLETSNMYHSCQSLVNAGSIPSTVTNCDEMFSGCTKLKEGAIFDPVPECDRSYMYGNCFNLVDIYDIECTEQTFGMYTSCFSLSLSEEQIGDLNFVDPVAIAKTFPNCSSLLKHYFVPFWYDAIVSSKRYFGLNEMFKTDDILRNWLIPFTEYGFISRDLIEGLLYKVYYSDCPDILEEKNLKNVVKQQIDLYRKPNPVSAPEDSMHAKGVNAFL